MDEVLEEEWEKFLLNDNINTINNININNQKDIPKSTELYISTKTKISYLSIPINLYEIFWKIPITEYNIPKVGIIKKQMKFNFTNKEDIEIVEKRIRKIKICWTKYYNTNYESRR